MTQPAPTPNNTTPIPVLVCADLTDASHLGRWRQPVIARVTERAEVGRRKYGTYLQPGNGRNSLADLDDEIVDAAQYAKQALLEMRQHSPNHRDVPRLVALYEDLLSMACAVAQIRAGQEQGSADA